MDHKSLVFDVQKPRHLLHADVLLAYGNDSFNNLLLPAGQLHKQKINHAASCRQLENSPINALHSPFYFLVIGEKTMAEMEHGYDWRNINGKANAGLTTGIIGTAGWLLNGGIGNLFGGMGWNNGMNRAYAMDCCSDNMAVNRYELAKEQEIAQLKSEKALLESTIYTDKKSLELYAFFDGKLAQINDKICMQNTWNAVQEGRIRDVEHGLRSITTLKIDGSKICPEYMPRYNSWVAPAATDTATAPGA